MDAIAEALRTYQNQTAEDIESGRARMDSVKNSVNFQHAKLKLSSFDEFSKRYAPALTVVIRIQIS